MRRVCETACSAQCACTAVSNVSVNMIDTLRDAEVKLRTCENADSKSMFNESNL
jgi:hypothetical protein